MNPRAERLKDALHPLFRTMTGLKLVGDIHERPTWLGIYPPLDPLLRNRLRRVREAGVLFIHIPKNAGISVSLELYGTPLFHPTIRYYKRVAPDVVRDMPSFAIWRDPVSRFVSAYRFARSGGAPNTPIARAFRDQYRGFTSLDDALDHVEYAQRLYDVDHIFRPQIWYVADENGRIAVDQICLFENLQHTITTAGLPGLARIAHTNLSPPIKCEVGEDQLARLQRLYAVDFAVYEALRTETIPLILNERVAA